MPRRERDKELLVLNYFRTADLSAARLLLKLVRAAVEERLPAKPLKADATPPKPRARRGKKEVDAPLPGIQEQVGG